LRDLRRGAVTYSLARLLLLNAHGAQLTLGVHAASLNSVATLPITVINTRMQTADPSQRKGMVGTAAEILQTEGFSGLWRGIGPSLILSINPAITFLVFEKLKGTPELCVTLACPLALTQRRRDGL